MFEGVVPRTSTTAAVDVSKATKVKNCHGRSVDASGAEGVGATVLIEILQLLVEPRLQRAIDFPRRGGQRLGRQRGMP
jgi:hypothetical protein